MLSKHSGISEENITSGSFFDALVCERAHNDTNPWPNWVTESIFQRVVNWYHHYLHVTDQLEPQNIKRLTAGPMLREISERMTHIRESTLANSPDRLKYFVYSGHDSNIIAFLGVLGAFNGMQPPYASTILVELHQSKTKGFYVRAYYKNSTYDPHPLDVSQCGTECSLDQFISRSSKFSPTDFEAECLLPSISTFLDVHYKHLMLALSVLCSLLFGALILMSCKVYNLMHGQKRYFASKIETGDTLEMTSLTEAAFD